METTAMKMVYYRSFWLFFLLWNTVEAQIRYTVPEELKEGSVVGHIANDLGLEASDIAVRKLRISAEAGKQYFSVDLGNGELVVKERIDRESLCGQSPSCLLPLQVVIEEPLQLYRVEVEIQDINDNGPVFPSSERVLNIAESTATGARFLLKGAIDPDVGSNSLNSYKLNHNDLFVLNIKTNRDGTQIPELVLKKTLDREKKAVHQLVLTAFDGGNPVRSGITEVTVQVLDSNDNAPIFEKSIYEHSLLENSPKSTVMLTVKAFDVDDGSNGDIEYFFDDQTPDSIQNMFTIDSKSGQLTVTGSLDYEERHIYEFSIRARDQGTPALEGHCSVQIDILDVNDNAPEIVLTSLPNPVKEDAPLGTVVALIGAKDVDSLDNGKVNLSLQGKYPFKLNPSFVDNYAIITDSKLDREIWPEYVLKIVASDSGIPSLISQKEITVRVLDVNDNPPVFSQTYSVYVRENHVAGSLICSVSASDEDIGENAKISYSILDSKVKDVSISSYIYINSDNGSIYSMHSFDYEKLKVFQITVQAKDHGSPSLSSNTTVHVFILDQNDNIPAVIYPSAVTGSNQRMPRSAKAGHLATKISAVDADSGNNAWISYRLVEATDLSLFSVNIYTGEVRTKRAVSEQDDSSQRLFIEVKDNGDPAQSATVTVNILLEDGLHVPISDFREKTAEASKTTSKITFYLIISLASVSVLSLLTFLILVMKCVRNCRNSSSCCIRRADSDGYKNPNRNLQIQLNTDGPIKYVEVLGGDMLSQSQSFRSCLSPMSEFSDFTLVKPSSTTDFKDMINVIDASLPDSAWTFESQQVSTIPV